MNISAAHLPLQGVRVLVVDDDEAAREVLQSVLQSDGAIVVTAESAVDALHELDDAVPDVLVSDIGMPVTDGFAFIESVRRRSAERGGSVPAAALTGYISAEDRARARRAGFQEYLIKPVDPAELVDVVRALARSRISEYPCQPTRDEDARPVPSSEITGQLATYK